VPVGTRALHWLGRYLTEARPRLAPPGDADDGTVFLTYTGRRLSRDFLSETVTA
jgi:integrase/recombinase XerD